MNRLKLRIRFYWRKTLVAIGVCPDCHNFLNTKPNGRKWCPECGKANL